MQRTALGLTGFACSAAMALMLSLWPNCASYGQFRDVTPRDPSEKQQEEPLSPQPLDPQVEMSERPLEPQPAPQTSAAKKEEEEEAAAEREAALADQMEKTLVDDTSIRALPFRGITAGTSKEEDVRTSWGDPFRETDGEKSRLLKYRLAPFRQVDVTIDGETVTAILIHLDGLLSPEHIENELRMTKLHPTPVRDTAGRPIGLAYPERGVLLAYDTSDPDMLVAKIQLEQITAEPFLLRAENNGNQNFTSSLEDLQTALDLNPEYAEAHWVRAVQFAKIGRYHDALGSSSKATNYARENARYRMTRVQLMDANGNRQMALRETKSILQQKDLDPAVRAAAQSLLGSLIASSRKGAYKQAMQYQLDAIEIAAKLVNVPDYRQRRSAKETLIRAHLAVARCISMGDFQKQKQVVPKWLNRSRALIHDYVDNEEGDRTLYLDLYRRILATAADIRNPEDPSFVVRELQTEGRRLIANSDDPLQEKRVEWKLGAAMAEAVRLQRQRGKDKVALEMADDALELLQTSAKKRQSTPEQTYLIGRLYFHTGSLHAVQQKDHQDAIKWYKMAEPLLADEQPVARLADPGTHGEMFVSMGVSYWEVGQKRKAIEITEFGTDFLQRAVVEGTLTTDALTIPYGNLATMHKKNGNDKEAEAFAELAASIEKQTVTQ